MTQNVFDCVRALIENRCFLFRALPALVFKTVCERAVEEAELMAQVHRDIFNKDAVVLAHGVAKGVLPTELLGLGLAMAGEECVAIVMRLETGGSLEDWLHPKTAGARGASQSAVANRTTLERLCMALEVARGM